LSTEKPSPVFFHYQHPSFRIRHSLKRKLWLLDVANKHTSPVSRLDIIFCTDEYLLELNQSHLQHDYYTDIITFDLHGDDGIEAELYISVDRVRDNASSVGASLTDELDRVMVHGVLHLVGFGDKTPSEITAMRAAEEANLSSRTF
jgi:probable rRNA maturation factor